MPSIAQIVMAVHSLKLLGGGAVRGSEGHPVDAAAPLVGPDCLSSFVIMPLARSIVEC